MPNSAVRKVWQVLDARLFQDSSANATLVTLTLPSSDKSGALPLQGWAGWVDWRTHGLISHFIANQAITHRDSFVLLPFAPPNTVQKPVQILLQIKSTAGVEPSKKAELGQRIQHLGSHLTWAIPRSELGSEQACDELAALLGSSSKDPSVPRLYLDEKREVLSGDAR